MSGSLSDNNTTITPIYRLKRVLFGVANNLEQIMGMDPLNDTNGTLNTLYGVEPTTLPDAHPVLGYFGIGRGGKRNVDSTDLSQPVDIKQTNMNIYKPMPIRCVPYTQDLDDTERAQYRMRQVIDVNGSKYVCYWLKVLTRNNSKIQFFKLDSNDAQTPYTPDYSNLTPTAPVIATDGTAADIGSEINAIAVVTVSLTGAELSEGINVLNNGDGRYGTISEVGLYTGNDKKVQALDHTGTAFGYTESVLTQLHTHYTFNGYDMSTPNAAYAEQFSFGSGRVILL